MKFQVSVVVVVEVEDESDGSSDEKRNESGDVPEDPHVDDNGLTFAGQTPISDDRVRLHAEF